MFCNYTNSIFQDVDISRFYRTDRLEMTLHSSVADSTFEQTLIQIRKIWAADIAIEPQRIVTRQSPVHWRSRNVGRSPPSLGISRPVDKQYFGFHTIEFPLHNRQRHGSPLPELRDGRYETRRTGYIWWLGA